MWKNSVFGSGRGLLKVNDVELFPDQQVNEPIDEKLEILIGWVRRTKKILEALRGRGNTSDKLLYHCSLFTFEKFYYVNLKKMSNGPFSGKFKP